MRDRLFVMDTSVAPEPKKTVQIETTKLVESLLLCVRDLQTRVEALEDEATMPMIEVEPTRYGRAVICGTIYEIEEDEHRATIRIHPADETEPIMAKSETVAGAIATMLDFQGNAGVDYLLGISLAAEDLVGQDEA